MEVSGKKLRNLCKPCEKRKSSTYTDRSCLHCEEEMCQSCFDTHVQFKVSREHRLVKSFEVPLEREKTPLFDNCTKHLNEAIKFFCPEHSQVGCADCIIISHKNCKVEYILERINDYKNSGEFKRFKEGIDKYDSEAKAMLDSIKCNIVHVRDVNNTFVRDVNLFRDEMISHITHLAERMLRLGRNAMRRDMNKIENLEKENESLVDETTTMRETLQSEADQPYRLFITTISYEQNLSLVQEQLKKIKVNNTVGTYTFERDCHLDQLVKSCKQLGSTQGLKLIQEEFAEKLQELYDNEWTFAYESLDQQMGEKQVIHTLLDTIVMAYDTCQNLSSRNFFERVQKAIELPIESAEISNDKVVFTQQLKQEINEFRKNCVPFVVRDIEMAVRPKLQLAKHPSKNVQEYVTKCIEITWLCAVQDPPLELDAKCTDRFDTNIFKFYTKRGEFVDFMVWPAMFLHKGGPLLSKGVAQGRANTGKYTHRHYQVNYRDYKSYQRPDTHNIHYNDKS